MEALETYGFNHNDPDDGLNSHGNTSPPYSHNRDYHYYDYSAYNLVWDGDKEIWTVKNATRNHVYGDDEYAPGKINTKHNNGVPGYRGYTDYDYRKGRSGYYITYGVAQKNYLSHEFASHVNPGKNNEDLKDKAEKTTPRKDKYNPVALVTVSDMSYEIRSGNTWAQWKYTRRTEPFRITRELSAVESESVILNDKEYIPLNAREEDTDYLNNKVIVYWGEETGWRTEDVEVNGTVYEDQRVPYRYEVPQQQVDHWNP